MNTWKHDPADALVSRYVDCYWLIEKSEIGSGIDTPRLNPDPAGTLIVAPLVQRYFYRLDGAVFEGVGGHLIAPNTRTMAIDHSDPFVILGIKFRVGALYSLKFDNVIPLIDGVIGADRLLPPSMQGLCDLSLYPDCATAAANTSAALDAQLRPWLAMYHEDPHSALVRQVLAIFDQTTLAEIGAALGCSQRTVERSFRRVTGLTLKQFEMMNRVERLLAYLYQLEDASLNWADIAAQFGFSDQPHLIRKLKSTLGATPKSYLDRRDITIDVYGDFE